ncbi:MAG: 50S ribosome-binding GTPase, partial [Chloroflexi bacterium]|nr:50S ribosome-binding GTPase [Chloroflexota bacterium]
MFPPSLEPVEVAPEHLVDRVTELSRLAALRLAQVEAAGPAAERARQLADHVRSYLLPRARSLDAPLLAVLLGPTGAGKSTLMNTLAGRAVSRTGVLRPTTREAVLVATEVDARALLDDGPLSTLVSRIETVTEGGRGGVAIVDAPDIDSIERDNRALADALVEAADLCVFVTTATRYADQVPWDVLARVRQRRLPLVVVVNRLPPDPTDASAVVSDMERLLSEAGLGEQADGTLAGAGQPGDTAQADGTGSMAGFQVIGVVEGELDASGSGLDARRVQPLITRIDALAADRDERRALAARALAGALAGVGSLVHAVADDLEHQSIEADAVRRIARGIYDEELRSLADELRGGRFLREEVIRQWHAFVGADQITRLFSSGIGKLRGTILSVVRGTPPAPVAAVEAGATSDLSAVAMAHAAEAARRTAARWSERPITAELVAARPE